MDSRALAFRLEGDAYKASREFRDLLSQAPFARSSSLSPQAHQERVLEWCRWFADQGYGRLGLPPSLGGDPFRFQILSYELGLFDVNLMMRFGLQFGFVLRAVSRLGSRGQEPWLKKIARMEHSTCLAMTEADHGSNVQGMKSEAHYEPSLQRFVLRNSVKDFVTSAGSSDLALVFAQLVMEGESRGVHAFLLPLRDESGDLLPGIAIESLGLMGGLNGLDYGRIRFEDVEIPKENHLERHAYIDAEGRYIGTLKSDSHRFNALMGTLVVGRGLLSAGASAGAKICLSLAIRYGNRRRQFKAKADSVERTLLSYQAHQRKLMPPLATLLALDAGRRRLAQCQHEYFEDNLQDRKLETFTAALKAYASDFAVRLAQLCRESCGGVGCLDSSRLTEIRKDLDLFTTMEGDNTVLHLMVARNLLTDFRRGLDGPKILKALAWAGKGVNLAAQTNLLNSKSASTDQLTSPSFFDKALRFRVDRLRYSLARRVRVRLSQGIEIFDAMNDCQDHCLSLSRAHCEEKIYRCLRNLTESCPPGWDKRVLSRCLALFALSKIEDDKAWFLEHGYINPRQSQAIRNQVLALCSDLAQESGAIVDAFELSNQLLASTLLDQVEV